MLAPKTLVEFNVSGIRLPKNYFEVMRELLRIEDETDDEFVAELIQSSLYGMVEITFNGGKAKDHLLAKLRETSEEEQGCQNTIIC